MSGSDRPDTFMDGGGPTMAFSERLIFARLFGWKRVIYNYQLSIF